MATDGKDSKEKITISCCESCWLTQYISANNSGDMPGSESAAVRFEVKKYCKGDTLVKKGAPAFGVYCIKSGRVKVYTNGAKGQEFILCIDGPEDIVGVSGMMGTDAYYFSAVAMEDVTACFIVAPDLKRILDKAPEIRGRLIKGLYDRLKFMEQRIVSISKKKIKEQFAEILMSVADMDKLRKGQGSHIRYSLNDLACIIGTNRNYLYKVVAELADRHILSMHKNEIIIDNIDALAQIAKGNNVISGNA